MDVFAGLIRSVIHDPADLPALGADNGELRLLMNGEN